jgi:predicted lipid-binding transport protein (Tim44 family)
MESQPEKPRLPPDPDRPSFFGLPTSCRLLARLGARFWGGLLAGLGLGLFAASFLEELGFWRTAWVGFIAVVLAGIGQGIAIASVRRSLETEKQKS